jgi:glycosyltransferase involved in cell wall biosynthesis
LTVGIVIPAYKEEKVANVITHIKTIFPNALIICPCDDENTSKIALKAGAIVPPRQKRLGYGKSLVEGLYLAAHTYDCEYIFEMDVDHPVHELKKMFNFTKQNRLDMCVGNEKAEWKQERRFACWLANFFLVDYIVEHPTCGLVCFRKNVLTSIPWNHVKSNGDFVHIELLYWAKQRMFKIGEYDFSGHAGERRYSLRRMIDWLLNFSRLIRLKNKATVL